MRMRARGFEARRAGALMAAGHLEEAMAVLERGYDAQDPTRDAFEALARAAVERGRLVLAARVVRRLDSPVPEVRALAARLARAGDRAAALELLDEKRRQVITHPQAVYRTGDLLGLGAAYRELGEHRRLAETLAEASRQALHAEPRQVLALALTYFELGQPGPGAVELGRGLDAVRRLSQAIRRGVDDCGMEQELYDDALGAARSFLAAGRFREARAVIDVIPRVPWRSFQVRGLVALATALRAAGQGDAARRAQAEAVALLRQVRGVEEREAAITRACEDAAETAARAPGGDRGAALEVALELSKQARALKRGHALARIARHVAEARRRAGIVAEGVAIAARLGRAEREELLGALAAGQMEANDWPAAAALSGRVQGLDRRRVLFAAAARQAVRVGEMRIAREMLQRAVETGGDDRSSLDILLGSHDFLDALAALPRATGASLWPSLLRLIGQGRDVEAGPFFVGMLELPAMQPAPEQLDGLLRTALGTPLGANDRVEALSFLAAALVVAKRYAEALAVARAVLGGADELSLASGAPLARVLAASLPQLGLPRVMQEIQATAHPGARAIALYGLFLALGP